MKKKYIAVFAVLLLLIAGLTILNSSVIATENSVDKIAYVDMYYLFENHPQHKEAEFEFEDEARRIKEELEIRGSQMTDEERQELLLQYENHLTDLEHELINQILVDINDAIEIVAERREILLVVDESAVAYGGYDLTDDVLAVVKEQREEVDSIELEINQEDFEEDNL